MVDITPLQDALQEMDVARYTGDHKRIAAAKSALILAKQSALPGDEPQSDAERFIEWRKRVHA